MNDILTAASLLLTVVGILYGLWYPEIMATLAQPIPKHVQDRQIPRDKVTAVLTSRAIPLSVAAALVALVFLPESASITAAAVLRLRELGPAAYLGAYDTVRTAFCAVELLAVGIGIHSFLLLAKLTALRNKLEQVETAG